MADNAPQYDYKTKEKIYYRLRRVLKQKTQQIDFIKKKIGTYYSLNELTVAEQEEKLSVAENICSEKQESYISHLVAELGLKIKNETVFSRQEAQFLISNLKEGKNSAVDRFIEKFEEL